MNEVGGLPEGHPLQIVAVGKKHEGKSELCYLLWDSWEGDRAVVDVTKDFIGLHPEPGTIDIYPPAPLKFPEHLREDGGRLSLRYIPDLRDPGWRDDVDRFLGLCYEHGDMFVVVEEVGNFAPVGLPLPNMRVLLHHGRHRGIYSCFNGPRTIGFDVLVLAQADVVYFFKLPSRRDRQRLADNIGVPIEVVDQMNNALAPHEYNRWVDGAGEGELVHFPPLPQPGPVPVAERHMDEPHGR